MRNANLETRLSRLKSPEAVVSKDLANAHHGWLTFANARFAAMRCEISRRHLKRVLSTAFLRMVTAAKVMAAIFAAWWLYAIGMDLAVGYVLQPIVEKGAQALDTINGALR
jgi:hypothetical protein